MPTSKIPQMQVYALRSAIGPIRAAGGDPEAVFERLGLTLADLDDFDRWVPTVAAFELSKAAAEITGDAFFGLHWGAAEEPSTLGAVGYVLLHSPTVESSLNALCRYLHLVYEGLELQVHRQPPLAAVRYRPVRPVDDDLRPNNEYAVAFVVRLLRLVVGADWRPHEIRFRHAEPEDTREYRRWLDVPIRYGADYNAVVFDDELLRRPNPSADANLLPILERHVADLVAKKPPEDDLLGSVRAHILHSLPTGSADLESVAARMETSVRTLQRRLGEQSVLFKDLVEAARRELSERYLEGTDLPLTEIAFLTGYSEVSAFTRAFRRWTGQTPLEFRRRPGA